jgi:hypothetical protein
MAAASVSVAQAPPAQTGQASEDPASADLKGELDAIRRELAAQREELERQRRELDAQRASLDEAAEAGGDDAELEALLSGARKDDEAARIQAFEPSFRVYGFADMGMQRFWGTAVLEGAGATNALTFVLGQVNFYFDAEPLEGWRVLTEVRFSLLPDGMPNTLPLTSMDGTYTLTNVADMTSPSGGFRDVKLGSIIMERAHIDYSVRDWLNIRTGLILTPYGIWNVDHGTPTLISTTFPGFQMVQLMPERQLGVEIFGRIHHQKWEYEYHLYVSNGRTMTQVDFTNDKAVGGRLVARTSRPNRMQFGLSGFMGTYQERTKRIDVATAEIFRIEEYLAYREQAVAADVSLDFGSLRIRSEAVFRRVLHQDGQRFDPRLNGMASDRTDIGGYALVAYRLPWWGLEPFLFMDFLKWPSGLADAILMPSAGLNVHLNPATVLKFQYTYLTFADFRSYETPTPDEHLHLALARLAIAF